MDSNFDPELYAARIELLRRITAEHADLGEPSFSLWTTRAPSQEEIGFRDRLRGANQGFSQLCDLPSTKVGMLGGDVFVEPPKLVFLSKDVASAYIASVTMITQMIGGIHRGIAPRADGYAVHISRLGRATQCLFHVEGVFCRGLLREYFLGFWALPQPPAGAPYVVSGQFRDVPLQALQVPSPPPPAAPPPAPLSPPLGGMGMSAGVLPPRFLKPSLYGPAPPPSPPDAAELNWFVSSPETERQLSLVKPRWAERDPTWRCDMCLRADTPGRRCGPRGPRTLCNACGLRWRRMNEAAAKAVDGDE